MKLIMKVWQDVIARLTLGIVCNSQVPLGKISDTGSRDEDVARVETTRDGSAGFGEG